MFEPDEIMELLDLIHKYNHDYKEYAEIIKIHKNEDRHGFDCMLAYYKGRDACANGISYAKNNPYSGNDLVNPDIAEKYLAWDSGWIHQFNQRHP
jgi:hypothetical protein